MRNKNSDHMGHFTVPMSDHFVNPDINTGRIDDGSNFLDTDVDYNNISLFTSTFVSLVFKSEMSPNTVHIYFS